MVSGPEDEFASFLDFGDLNFAAFGDGTNAPVNGTAGPLQPQDGGANVMDTNMEGTPTGPILGAGMPQMQEPAQMNGMTGFEGAMPDVDISSDFLDGQQPRHAQRHPQMQQPRYYGHNPVPPTPNSLEMHGSHGEYYQSHVDRQQQLMYEHYRRHHQNDQVRSSVFQVQRALLTGRTTR